ncbi:hypothetical protein LNQ81_01600 [Myroides sp. M-43]|uniref:hypothetical protein n=1 Tax=Myroides oncorhynchi TaxID=2893756 RepID=UPI001E29A0B3|nr:hypothetical protein [Myroides oncorhynchi]MCC9041414.1 hypothetical protein [Myroides oncorhynchi]
MKKSILLSTTFLLIGTLSHAVESTISSDCLEISTTIAPTLTKDSKFYIEFVDTENKVNVNGEDAKRMALSEFRRFSTCKLVSIKEDADFVLEVQVYKYSKSKRHAKITVKDAKTDAKVYETKWLKGSPSVFNGSSGTRQSIGYALKKDFLVNYPEFTQIKISDAPEDSLDY